MTTTFTRALSPLAASFAAASGAKAEDSSLARHSALLAANSLAELVAMVPIDYREVLRPILVEVTSNADKRQRMLESNSKLLHLSGMDPKQFPSSISTKVHETQLTKEYALTEEGRAFAAVAAAATYKYKCALLDNEISAKRSNVAHLDGLLNTTALLEAMLPGIRSRFAALKLTSKIPTFKPVMGGEEGQEEISGWVLSPAVVATYQQVSTDCVAYALRAISLVEARDIAVRAKTERKKEIKAAADVEMADATKPGPSIQSMIDKAVSAALKKSGKTVSSMTLNNRFSPTYHTMTAQRRRPIIVETGEQSRRSSRRSTRLENGASSTFANPWVAEVGQEIRSLSQQSREEERRSSRQEAFSDRQGQRFEGRRPQIRLQEKGWAREGQEEQQVVDPTVRYFSDNFTGGTLQPFRYDVPASYPDWLLTVDYPTATNYIILNTPVNVVLASQFKDSIHLSPGVEIPRELELQLSVGMRYMFHSTRNSKLIMDAWNDFERRIRWRLYFSFMNVDDGLYDPDFEVRRTSKKPAPKLPHYLEFGLRRGRSFVSNTISNIPVEEEKDQYRSLQPSPRRIGEFLAANDYIVTGTDKNLGIAVSKRDWVEEKCAQLLEDKDNYKLLNPLTAHAIFAKQCKASETAAEAAEDLPNGKQLSEFLRSQITPHKIERGKTVWLRDHIVPKFYGIPKIHKLPVKMRPIIPCHSAIQNPAAKFCSKKLKPLVKAAPTIIHGTKDLAIKLSSLKVDRFRKKYIVTGDVVAYYPNIPISHCLDIVAEQYDKFYKVNEYSDEGTDREALMEANIFHQCLALGNRDLVTQFKNKFFQQTRGLAMGVADSPDLANLYGWYFEEKCNILNHPDVPIYGRYIDDCFAIVYASSEQEAINKVSIVQFDECVIEWNASASQPFLDMTVYIDREGRIQHMPYRKARSHQERIPWISFHPIDVKRGTFIGEMSRLATLCSQFAHYKEAIDGLVGLYIKRGYPSDLVMKWMRDNFKTRWEKRISVNSKVEREHDDVLVLKSQFNSAWNYFSAHELGETVLGYWRTWFDQADINRFDNNNGYYRYGPDVGGLDLVDPDLCSEVQTEEGPVMMPDIRKLDILKRRTIVSRKRTRNLFDLTSIWKKAALRRLEEDVHEDDHKDVSPTHGDHDSDWDSDTSRMDVDDLEYVADRFPFLQ
jgi:hypothetical protein